MSSDFCVGMEETMAALGRAAPELRISFLSAYCVSARTDEDRERALELLGDAARATFLPFPRRVIMPNIIGADGERREVHLQILSTLRQANPHVFRSILTSIPG